MYFSLQEQCGFFLVLWLSCVILFQLNSVKNYKD